MGKRLTNCPVCRKSRLYSGDSEKCLGCGHLWNTRRACVPLSQDERVALACGYLGRNACECSKPRAVVQILAHVSRCEFVEPADGLRCKRGGKSLTLDDGLGNRIRRTLCRSHSDWIEAKHGKAS